MLWTCKTWNFALTSVKQRYVNMNIIQLRFCDVFCPSVGSELWLLKIKSFTHTNWITQLFYLTLVVNTRLIHGQGNNSVGFFKFEKWKCFLLVLLTRLADLTLQPFTLWNYIFFHPPLFHLLHLEFSSLAKLFSFVWPSTCICNT